MISFLLFMAAWIGLLTPPAVFAEQGGSDSGLEAPPVAAGGMSLSEAIETVLERSPMSQMADAGLLAAEHGKKSARGEFLPKLKTEFDYTRLDEVREIDFAIPGQAPIKVPSGTDEILSSKTMLEQPLFTGLALHSQYKMADLERQGADVQRTETRQELILMTYQSYYGILVAEKFVQVMDQTVNQLEAHVEVARQFYENGMIPKNDMLKSQVTLAEAKLRKIEAVHQQELAWVQFYTLLRLDPGTPSFRLSEPLARKPYHRQLEECVRIGLQQNPKIMLADADVRKGKKAVAMARSTYFPHFALVGGLTHEQGGFSEVGAEFSATLHGQWTVWEWGSNYYNVQKSKAQVQMAEAEKVRQMDLVRFHVREAYLKLRESDESIDVAQASIDQAEENSRITVEQYNENITTSTEVLDAQTLQAQAQMNYYRALTTYNVAIAALEKAMGTLGQAAGAPAGE
jgi:outer membrane protein TolC